MEKSACPNSQDIKGNTPLHLAALNGYGPSILQKLIQINSDINSENYFSETALTMAAKNNNIKGIEFLLSKGAKKNILTSFLLDDSFTLLKK